MPIHGINLTALPWNGVVEAQSLTFDLDVQTDEKEQFHYELATFQE